jgi:hypothetical protein
MNKSNFLPFKTLFVILLTFSQAFSQPSGNIDSVDADAFAGLAFRSIGPALMSGRIADIAIHPQNKNVWYVAVGSGGVWKTINSGTTWTPIFEDQGSYSIGCLSIDPENPILSGSGREKTWAEGMWAMAMGFTAAMMGDLPGKIWD